MSRSRANSFPTSRNGAAPMDIEDNPVLVESTDGEQPPFALPPAEPAAFAPARAEAGPADAPEVPPTSGALRILMQGEVSVSTRALGLLLGGGDRPALAVRARHDYDPTKFLEHLQIVFAPGPVPPTFARGRLDFGCDGTVGSGFYALAITRNGQALIYNTDKDSVRALKIALLGDSDPIEAASVSRAHGDLPEAAFPRAAVYASKLRFSGASEVDSNPTTLTDAVAAILNLADGFPAGLLFVEDVNGSLDRLLSVAMMVRMVVHPLEVSAAVFAKSHCSLVHKVKKSKTDGALGRGSGVYCYSFAGAIVAPE